MKKNYLLVCLLATTFFACIAQTQKLDGVYVGAQLYNTPFNGMQIDNIVIYFRNDGTFNNKLDNANWKTGTTGNYSINNGVVQLTFSNGDEPKQYKLSSNGALESTAGIKHNLHKVKKVSSLPAAGFERKSAASSGGMGTGMPNVMATSSGYLYFDGKGKFSLEESSHVGIGGDAAGGTVGGKFEKNGQPTGGTYKLGDGEITLTFNNGTVSKHSFFYSPPNEEDLVMLDGTFYFRKEDDGKAVSSQRTETRQQPNTTTSTSDNLPTAADVLSKLRSQYGGESIDKVTTIREKGTITGNLQMVMLTDIAQNKVRAELYQGGKLMLVKQLEGNDGWQWTNGVKKPLTQEEKSELRISCYQGVLGLHKKLNNHFTGATVSRSENDYMLSFQADGKKVVYLVGSDYTLKANAYTVNGTPNFTVYKNFVKTNGINYPTVTESSDGKTTITINTTSTEINPTLTAEDWKKP